MHEKCSVYHALKSIGKKWALLILLELHKGRKKRKRYSEVKRSLPEVTSKILSIRLKELEKDGLIKRKVCTEHYPIKSEYCLTPSGKELIKVLKEIKRWSLKWKTMNPECLRTDCKQCTL